MEVLAFLPKKKKKKSQLDCEDLGLFAVEKFPVCGRGVPSHQRGLCSVSSVLHFASLSFEILLDISFSN